MTPPKIDDQCKYHAAYIVMLAGFGSSPRMELPFNKRFLFYNFFAFVHLSKCLLKHLILPQYQTLQSDNLFSLVTLFHYDSDIEVSASPVEALSIVLSSDAGASCDDKSPRKEELAAVRSKLGSPWTLYLV
jgi:hypothetical protein